jgi:hypothetical protein
MILYQQGHRANKEGFISDVVYSHSGWVSSLFIKDIFPQAQLLYYFEWFYHAHGSGADFDPTLPFPSSSRLFSKLKNTEQLSWHQKLRD